MAADSRRWFNSHQPQTLQVSQWLLYFNALFGLLGFLSGNVLGLLTGLACGAAAFGIANEQRWGYALGVAAAAINVLFVVVLAGGFVGLFRSTALISFLFAAALLAALVHPMSRDYQRIWFH